MDIKPVKHKSTDRWMIVCPVGFEGATTRRYRYFDTKSGAADFAKVVNNWRHARKNPVIAGEIKINEAETTLLAVLSQYEIRSVPQLTEILSHWTATGPGAVTKTGLRDAVEAYLVYYAKEKSSNEQTLADVTGKLRNFAAEFTGLQVHEVTRQDIKGYLEDFEVNSTKNQHTKKLRAFFVWCTVERFVVANPAADIELFKDRRQRSRRGLHRRGSKAVNVHSRYSVRACPLDGS